MHGLKYIQQGIRGIFVGFLEDSLGWLFYVPNAREKCISLDTIFHENFRSLLSMLDLLFQGAFKLRSINMQMPNKDTLTEVIGPPTCENDTYPKDITRET